MSRPNYAESDALAVRQTVQDLVIAYEASVADIRSAFALLYYSETRMNAAFTMGDTDKIRLQDRHGRSFEFGDPEDVVARLRLRVWAHLVERLEIRRFLSVARAKELDALLDGKGEEQLPEITVENVLGMANGFRSQLSDMLREAVEEVFNFLRPRRSEYKRNSEYEVPPRIILSGFVERAWTGDGFRVNYYREQEIRALQNVFSSLDGKGQIVKTHYGELHDAIQKSPNGIGETPYFKFRAHKNRNLHLEFKRLDLLAKFNALAGGKRLRSAEEAA